MGGDARCISPYLLLRGVFAGAQLESLEADPDAYRQLAVTWRTTGVFGVANDDATRVRPTAYRPPLYPLVLGLLVRDGELPSWRVAVLHAILGAATAAVVLALGYRAGLGRWSYLAAGLTACDPILLNQTTVVMTETLAALLAVVGIGMVGRFSRRPSLPIAAACGAVLGLAVLCRPTFFFWLAFVVAAVLLLRDTPRRVRHAAMVLAAAAAVLAPWTIRNAVHFGRPIFATTHGGYTIWLANNDLYYDHVLKGESVFDAERLAPRLREIAAESDGGEVAFDRRLYDEAKDTIARRPAAFAYASLIRIGDLWRLLPRQIHQSESTARTLARLAVAMWYGGVYLLAVAGLVSLRGRLLRSPWLWAGLLCLAFTAVHAVYWTDMRMRAPLIPAVSLAAAAGAAWLSGARPSQRASIAGCQHRTPR
jgi:4-amino-4-deoxy-L-arabinose transferase-like glycosyltransferase